MNHRNQKQLSKLPFVRIIIPAVVGLLLSRLLEVEWWVVALCCMVMGVVGWWLGRRKAEMAPSASRNIGMANIYIWMAIMLFFFAISEFHTPRTSLPSNKRVVVAVQIAEKPHTRGRWQITTADVGYYRLVDEQTESGVQNQSGEGSEEKGWVAVNERVMLSIDTSYHNIEVGLQLAFRGWINPIDTTGRAYGNLMRMRGLHNRVYLTSGNLLWQAPHRSRTPLYYASKMQAAAIERLDRLTLTEDSKAVVTAMTVGDKRAISKEVRGSYSATGAAHLLAVSGLHVGIVFILINLLLYPLPTLRKGHIIKNIVAIIAIWLYAAMAGLAPSVVRSALMFSFAQLALATSSYRNGLNIMLGSAVLMLALNPNYATDPSFLLSYAAVLSIMLFFVPLYRWVSNLGRKKGEWRKRSVVRKIGDGLLSVILVGFVATLGTAPLVSYWFGTFPVVGILINPVVILTAHVIVMVGVLWIIFPIGFLSPLFSSVLSLAAGLQNWVVEWSSSLSWAWVGVRLPLWAVVAIYGGYIGFAVWFYSRKRNQRRVKLE